MQKKTSVFVVLLVISLLPLKIHSQSFIALKTAIENGLKENANLKQAKFETKIYKAQRNQSNAAFLPQIELNYTALYTNNPLNAFGFKLNQRSVTQQDFNPALLNYPQSSQNYGAEISIKQPLLNLDALAARKAARHALKAKQYVEKRTSEGVRFQIKTAYLQIGLAYRNITVLKKATQTAASFEKRAQDMYNEGIVQQADLLEAKAYHLRMRSDLQTAKSEVANASDQLSLLMGKNPGTIYTVEEIQWEKSESNRVDINLRSDLLAYRSKLSAAEKMYSSQKMSWFPRLNAFANYQYNDKKFGRFDANSYLLGVSLSWTLFDGNQRLQKTKKARLERDKTANELAFNTQKARSDYEKTRRALEDLNLNLDYAQKMVQQAKEAWRVQQDRYAEGLAPTSDLLRTQAQLAEYKLRYEFIRFKKNTTIAYLNFITSK